MVKHLFRFSIGETKNTKKIYQKMPLFRKK